MRILEHVALGLQPFFQRLLHAFGVADGLADCRFEFPAFGRHARRLGEGRGRALGVIQRGEVVLQDAQKQLDLRAVGAVAARVPSACGAASHASIASVLIDRSRATSLSPA